MASQHLVVIVGPTASGKSALAIRVAQSFDGELICADSQTIHRGLDLLTAKPTVTDRALVPHWGVDLVEAGESYSAAQFQTYAEGAIRDIQGRGRLPILVGGSGLYINATVYGYDFRPVSVKKRAPLLALDLPHLVTRARKLEGFEQLTTSDQHNPRRLMRFIESGAAPSSGRSLRQGVIFVGLNPATETLLSNITQRAARMFELGLAGDEVPAAQNVVSTGKGIVEQLQRGSLTADEAQQMLIQETKRLAKKQITWFKRDPHITWFDDADRAFAYIETRLSGSS